MSRRSRFWYIFLAGLLLSGCGLIPQATAVQPPATQAPANQAVLPTITQAVTYIIVTATPQPQAVIAATATPLPNPTPQPTATPMSALTLNALTDQGNGNLLVSWDPSGAFPQGIQVLWSNTNPQPSFPGDSSTYVADVNTRSVTIRASPGRTVYVRLCRYINDACDVYSNVQSLTMSGTVVPYIYNQPGYLPAYQPLPPYSSYPTVIATVNPYIYISMIKWAGSGGADIYWRTYGSFNNGYRLLFSTSASTNLVYGDTLQYVIPSGYTHMLTVNGVNGVTYYYRICRYTGTTCDLYSQTVSFTFSDQP